MEGAQDASGLYYHRNRYYDPATGRFTQPDPIGLAGGLNLYGFAAGDPVNLSDPFGLFAIIGVCPPDCGEFNIIKFGVGSVNAVRGVIGVAAGAATLTASAGSSVVIGP